MTVALDTAGPEAARSWIEAASPEHPSLIDAEHVLDERLGVVNVPNGVWIDEEGVLVRPVEPAHVQHSPWRKGELPSDMPERRKEMLMEARKIRTDPEAYVNALRDWVDRGASSAFALSPEEVVNRSAPRPAEAARAAACFELGAHLWLSGQRDGAIRWWREAHELQPENWTYKRQAWSLMDPLQGHTDAFEGDWLSEVRALGAENYYPAVTL